MSDLPAAAPESKLSNAALFSLIIALVVCIPFGGIIAVILGIFGFMRTKEPGVRGRGLAIAGILLGIGNVVTQIIVVAAGGIGLIMHLAGSAPSPQATTDSFIKDIAAGAVLLDYLTAQCDAITAGHFAVSFKPFEPEFTLEPHEAVHKTRVATRRLRASRTRPRAKFPT